MITDLKPYPAMKDSGVEWLGDVPEHWEVLRLGNLLRERREINSEEQIQEVLSVLKDRGVIPYVEKGNIGNKKSEDITRYKIVRPDDIVMNCMNVIIGSVGLSQYTGCLSPVYYVLTRCSEDDNPRYLNAYFQTKTFQRSLVRIGNGILAHRMRIPMELLKCELFPRPPLPEQNAIVRFLDYVERRVRRLIRAKQKMIELLEELKQAIIHRTVTRGLDPDVPLKPSGVEWLGDVPEHWEVRQLGRIGQFSKGHGGTKKDEVDDGISCIRYGDLYMHHKFFIRKSRFCVTQERAIDYTPIQYGDLLFAGSGETIDEIGKSAVNLIKSETCCGGDVIFFRPSIDVEPQFMGYATDCPQAVYQKACMGRGITVMHIYGDQLKYMWIALPSLPEQKAIVEYLDKATTNIDTAIDRRRREIELLREFRTRLISDVVTGKLDVREAAANLPDELDEEDIPDEDDELIGNGDDIAKELDEIVEEVEE